MSDSVRPHRRQPTRLCRPWDSQGKNTGVGCHFLLQRMKVKSESEVAQSCPTPSDPMNCSPPGSFIHGICQAGVLECVAHSKCSVPGQKRNVIKGLISYRIIILCLRNGNGDLGRKFTSSEFHKLALLEYKQLYNFWWFWKKMFLSSR